MKLKAFILAAYISFLIVQPVMAQVYSQLTHHTKTCSHDCCKNKQDPNNCCPNGVCNPFGMCTCCFIYNPAQQAYDFIVYPITTKLASETNHKIVSTFLSDCFHPPEIIW